MTVQLIELLMILGGWIALVMLIDQCRQTRCWRSEYQRLNRQLLHQCRNSDSARPTSWPSSVRPSSPGIAAGSFGSSTDQPQDAQTESQAETLPPSVRADILGFSRSTEAQPIQLPTRRKPMLSGSSGNEANGQSHLGQYVDHD